MNASLVHDQMRVELCRDLIVRRTWIGYVKRDASGTDAVEYPRSRDMVVADVCDDTGEDVKLHPVRA